MNLRVIGLCAIAQYFMCCSGFYLSGFNWLDRLKIQRSLCLLFTPQKSTDCQLQPKNNHIAEKTLTLERNQNEASQLLLEKSDSDFYFHYSVSITAKDNDEITRCISAMNEEISLDLPQNHLDDMINMLSSTGSVCVKKCSSLEEAFELKHRLQICGATAKIVDDDTGFEIFTKSKPKPVKLKIDDHKQYHVFLHCPNVDKRDELLGIMIQYYKGTDDMSVEQIADIVDESVQGSSCIARTNKLEEALDIEEWLTERGVVVTVEDDGHPLQKIKLSDKASQSDVVQYNLKYQGHNNNKKLSG